jgi:hypothetical protein
MEKRGRRLLLDADRLTPCLMMMGANNGQGYLISRRGRTYKIKKPATPP